MTSSRKLFIGPRVRRLREQYGWNQSELAERLTLSLSYVSQIENNQRPVTAGVLLKLAEAFGGDIAQFSEEQDRRQLTELDLAMRDRTLRSEPLSPGALVRLTEQAPELVEAFLTLYRRHGRLQEEHAQTVDRFYGDLGADAGNGRSREPLVPLPHEEVRDYFNRCNNYVDSLDQLGEAMARDLQLRPGQRAAALREALYGRCGVEVALIDSLADPEHGDTTWLRRFSASRRRLEIPTALTDAQQAFQIATQYALLAYRSEIDAEVRNAGFEDPATQGLARQGLSHYFAAAVLLPYTEFLSAAKHSRYDIELLQRNFHVGFETVCHRLSTLQRAGARAVPFYFVRLDQAGNISKRHSATGFHFARHGGACPLWHVHEAFAQPERILTQVAEMPDGMRFFGIARTTVRGGGGFRSRKKLFAVGLGCELSHARELVYADGVDLDRPRDVVPIGPGCRVCPRADCVQRAFPPAGKPLVADTDHDSLVSYRFKSD